MTKGNIVCLRDTFNLKMEITIKMIKPIYTAIAAPGAGKTKALITQLPTLIGSGKKFIIAFPTLNLCNDVITEMQSLGLNPKVINHDCSNNKSVANMINGTLKNGNDDLVIVTHEGLRLSDPGLLRTYTLVIDEVPGTFEFNHILKLDEKESETLLAELDSIDGLLYIKHGRLTHVKNRVSTYKAALKNNSAISTLSPTEYQIFNTLISKGSVHHEKTTINGKIYFNFFTIEDKSIFKHMQKAHETHILAANIDGGMFHCISKLHGYKFKKSRFTPDNYEYSNKITIYPMLNEPWSKSKVLLGLNGEKYDNHLGQQDVQVIDKIFNTAIKNTPDAIFITAQNKWANFNNNYITGNDRLKIEFVPLDCRGLNTFKNSTAAILLFSGQPSPNDKKCLKVISDRLSIPQCELIKAWITDKKLETSLQAATRTAVRNRDNDEHIHLYVQDMSVAEYLKNTYMKNAAINNSLSIDLPKRQDGRKKTLPSEEKEITEYIKSAWDKGMKRCEIKKFIVAKWAVSDVTANRWTKHLAKEKKLTQTNLAA